MMSVIQLPRDPLFRLLFAVGLLLTGLALILLLQALWMPALLLFVSALSIQGGAVAFAMRSQLQQEKQAHAQSRRHLSQAYDQIESLLASGSCERVDAHFQMQSVLEDKQAISSRLKASEYRFSQLCDKAPVGIFTTDTEGICLYINPRWRAITGRPFAAMRNLPWTTIIGDPLDRELIHTEWRRVIQENQPFQFEYHIERRINPSPSDASGRTHKLRRAGERDAIQSNSRHGRGEFFNGVWVLCQFVPEYDLDGTLVGAVGTLTDITVRRQAERERERLAKAIDQAAEIVWITDAKGVIDFSNAAYESQTGRACHKVLGRSLLELPGTDEEPQIREEIQKGLQQGVSWQGRLPLIRREGASIQTEARLSPMRNVIGELDGYVAIMRNITTEMALEAQLRKARRLEAVGTLAGGIAHDFNNLLTPILGFTELVLDGQQKGTLHHRNLTLVMEAAHRARDLVAQILTFSRRREQDPARIRMTPIIKEALRMLRATLPTSVKIISHLEVDHDHVMADPVRIHQVVMNLATNAAHAMESQGRGVLTVALHEDDALDQIILSVCDTGEGITREVKERIFEPFFTTRDTGEGTGLGLSVVHGIVEGCGGSIQVRTEPGRGTTFEIHLPRAEAEEAEPDRSTTVTTLAEGSESILLVDDEPLVLTWITHMLERLGYNVRATADPNEALALFKEETAAFDLVITDYTMPGMNGRQLLGKIRQLRTDLPVILCTGLEQEFGTGEAEGWGFGAILSKPLTPRPLSQAVRTLLDAHPDADGE